MNAAPFPDLSALLPMPSLSDTSGSHAHALEVLHHSALLRAMLVVLKSTLPPPPGPSFATPAAAPDV
jgi:hypothetical protein